jgi:hypothetical protein
MPSEASDAIERSEIPSVDLSEAKFIAIERSEIPSEASDAIERSDLPIEASVDLSEAKFIAIERSEIHSN